MSTAHKPAPTVFTDCPFWGQGGRYIVDADGKRVKVSESVSEGIGVMTPVTGDTLTAEINTVETTTSTTVKGKKNA